MAIFDSKNWNAEVFQKYLETVPRVKQNALLTSGVLRTRNDLKTLLTDQVGGNYINVPIVGRIGGDVLNYDGATNITATGLGTFLQSMIVFGRAKAWEEKDFTTDITGKDFMEEIAKQVGSYWDDVDQSDLLAVLEGVFDVSSNGFNETHTLDLTTESTNVVDATSLNNVIQKAAGANKNIFKLAIMHSQVATNLENLKLLEYAKGVDKDGLEKDMSLGTWNGRTVLIDDDVPTSTEYTSAGVYTVTIGGGNPVVGDTFTVAGETVTVAEGDTLTPTAVATSLATALGSNTYYSVSRSGAVLTLTEKSGKYGTGEPKVSTTSQTTTAISEVTTAPVGVTNYTTYILGVSSIDFCNCGAKVPNEVKRDATTDGGIDMLITRQRHLLAPVGFSYINTSKISPMPTDLANSNNWALVKDTNGLYYPSKAIALARIISRG